MKESGRIGRPHSTRERRPHANPLRRVPRATKEAKDLGKGKPHHS